MSEDIERFAELSKETQEVIRFLLRDNAFDSEFLLTAIQEYCLANSAKVRAAIDEAKTKTD